MRLGERETNPSRHRGPVRTRDEVNNARLRHRWLRINRVLRVMLQTRWSAEAWSGSSQAGARGAERDPAREGDNQERVAVLRAEA